MGHVYASCVTCLTSDTCCAPCCAPRQEVLRIASATFRPKDAANCALDVLHECEKAVQSALVNKNNPSKIVWSQRVFCAQAIFEQLLRPLFASQTVLLGPAVQGTVVFVYHELARVAFLLRESFLCAQWPAIDRTASVVCDEKHQVRQEELHLDSWAVLRCDADGRVRRARCGATSRTGHRSCACWPRRMRGP